MCGWFHIFPQPWRFGGSCIDFVMLLICISLMTNEDERCLCNFEYTCFLRSSSLKRWPQPFWRGESLLCSVRYLQLRHLTPPLLMSHRSLLLAVSGYFCRSSTVGNRQKEASCLFLIQEDPCSSCNKDKGGYFH